MDNYMKEGIRMQGLVCNKQVGVDLNCDFTLPDYQPEIKRLLRVRATVSPADKYVGVGNAELSGTVDYCILYAANDGALYSAMHTEEYSFGVPVEMTSDFEIGEGLTCDVETVAENVVGRVASPRKLSLRCRLRSDVRIYGTRAVEERVDAEDASALQRLHGEASCAHVFVGCGEPLALEDEILFDSQWADLRMIAADGQVFVSEAVAGSGCVSCRGEVYLKLLYCHESGESTPTVQIRKLPFSQSVPVDGCEVNCDAAAHGVCSDLHVTVEEGRVLCDVSVRLQARAQRNETLAFTRDLYSTASECDTRHTELSVATAEKCVNGNVSFGTTMTLDEAGMRPSMSVLDVSMTAGAITVERERDKYMVCGRCRCHLILSDGEELSAQELEIPFRYEIDGAAGEVAMYDATVDPVSCRARLDGERIAIDGELAVCVAIRDEARIRVLSEAHFGEAVKRPRSVYTVCFPSRTDTLWSVAKRYYQTVDAVSEWNTLSPSAAADSTESLAGVAYLLV